MKAQEVKLYVEGPVVRTRIQSKDSLHLAVSNKIVKQPKKKNKYILGIYTCRHVPSIHSRKTFTWLYTKTLCYMQISEIAQMESTWLYLGLKCIHIFLWISIYFKSLKVVFFTKKILSCCFEHCFSSLYGLSTSFWINT